MAHDRIAAEPLGVVDVLIAGQTREDRLAQQIGKAMAAILPGARIGNVARRQVDQAKGVIKLTV